jgi:PAS domain-containing protein
MFYLKIGYKAGKIERWEATNMVTEDRDKTEMFRTVFDAMPAMVFVVDEDVRIQEYNATAAELLAGKGKTILRHRGGEVLDCLHSNDVPEGCGRAPYCSTCVIRNSVTEASHGNTVIRRRAGMEIVRGRDIQRMHALITASPFLFKQRPFVLLAIEDLNEMVEVQQMITICSVCKKVRDKQETWAQLEDYFTKQWGTDVSHGLCPKCFEHTMKRIEEEM